MAKAAPKWTASRPPRHVTSARSPKSCGAGCFSRVRWYGWRSPSRVAAVDLVRRFLDRPVVGEHTARPERGLGLHQGSPLSPLLCNLYLDGFDRAMLGSGYRAIRYSDDIAIPVADRGAAERALSDAA